MGLPEICIANTLVGFRKYRKLNIVSVKHEGYPHYAALVPVTA
jgi:hypothetical protein